MDNKEMEQDETRRKSSLRTARELCRELGYKRWEDFSRVTDKAMDDCWKEGQNVEDHFSVRTENDSISKRCPAHGPRLRALAIRLLPHRKVCRLSEGICTECIGLFRGNGLW